MKAFWSGQLSEGKTGWLFALLFFGFLAFLFVLRPKEPEAPPIAPFVKPPPSRLVALGLPDNPDLEHLPEFFALFADNAPWLENKVDFAFWHPGAQADEYFFEATRVNGTYRFRVIPRPYPAEFSIDQGMESDTKPIFFYLVPMPKVRPVTGFGSSILKPEETDELIKTKLLPKIKINRPPLEMTQNKSIQPKEEAPR